MPLWARWELTLPTLLLGLGTALLVVAAIVFTAVQWSELGAAVQALALVVVTLVAGWAARALRRRRLTATAEAVAVVTLALLPVDAHAVREVAQVLGWTSGPGGDPLPFWCLSIWAIAAVAWWFGRFSRTQAPRIIAAIAAQVPVPLYVLDRPVEAPWAELLCLLQAALVLVAVRRAPRGATGARITGAVGAVGTWLVVAPATVAGSLAVDGSDRVAGAVVVAAAAAVAGLVAAMWPDQPVVRTLCTAGATLAGLVAAGLAASAGVTGYAWCAVAAGISGAVLVGALRLPRRWGDPPALVAAAAGALTSLPVVVVAGVGVNTALDVLDVAWEYQASTPMRRLAGGTFDLPGGGVVAAQLAILALVAVGARPRLGRKAIWWALGAVGVLAVLALPVAADLTVAAAVTIALAGAAVPVVALAPRSTGRNDARPAGVFGVLAGLAVLWAAAAPGTTLVALGVVALLAGVLAAGATRDGTEAVAYAGAVVAAAAIVAGAGLAVSAASGPVTTAWVVAGVTGAGVTLVAGGAGGLLRRTAGGRAAATLLVAQGVGIALHALALLRLAGTGGDARDFALLVASTTVLAAWFCYRGVRDRQESVASLGAVALALASAAEAGLVAATVGVADTTVTLAVGLTAAAAALAFPLVDWRGDRTGARGDAAAAGASMAVVVHAGAAAVLVLQRASARDLGILLAATIVVAAWSTFVGLRAGSRGIAAAAAAAFAAAVGIEAGLVAVALGATQADAALASGLTAALATPAFAALDWRGTRAGARGDAALAGEAACATVHAGALVLLVASGGGLWQVVVLVAATIGVAAWWAYRGVRDGSRDMAVGAAVALALAVAAEGGVVAAALGAGTVGVALAAGLTAAGETLAFAALDRRGVHGGARGGVALEGEAASAVAHVVALGALVGVAQPRDVAMLVAASIGLAAWWAYRGLRDGNRDMAIGGTMALAAAVAAEAGLVTAALGGVDTDVALAVGLTAAGTALAFALVHLRGARTEAGADAATAGEATAAILHAGALFVLATAAPAGEIAVLVGATVVLAAWGALRGVRDGNRTLAAWSAAALALAVGAEGGLLAAAAHAVDATVALVVGVTAAVTVLGFAALDWTGLREDVRGDVARAGEVAAGTVHVGAIVALLGGPEPLDQAGAASVVLAAGAAVAALQAVRPGRRPVAAWAVVEAVGLIWLRLAVAGVGLAEAYTLPVAAAFLGAAVIARRTGRATRFPSWVVDGPWLVVAFAPTVVLAVADGGVVRSLVGLAAGTVVLVVGAATRRRAPVDVGVVVVVVLGVRQLAPVVGSLPNWATLGACGLLLLIAGATFEERRRDLRAIRDRYTHLV